MEPLHLFVSHSHTDVQFTEQLVRDLKRTGAEVWVDQDGIRDGNIVDRINDALGHADWLILVQTPDAMRSHFVKAEMAAALMRVMSGLMQGVIPVIAKPCDPLEVPPLWQMLRYYDATQDYSGALTQLEQALGIDKAPTISAAAANGAQWSPVDLMRLWSWVTPGTRRAVGEIARRPEGYPYPEVLQRLGCASSAGSLILSSAACHSTAWIPRLRASSNSLQRSQQDSRECLVAIWVRLAIGVPA